MLATVEQSHSLAAMPQKGIVPVTAYVTPEIKKRLEKWAKDDDRSISWLLNKLIEDALNERDNQQQ